MRALRTFAALSTATLVAVALVVGALAPVPARFILPPRAVAALKKYLPELGVITDAAVALPALGEVHRSDTVTAPVAPPTGPIRITASSNRPPAVLWRLRDRLDIEFLRIGSAGAKAMAVVRGDADAYIHAGGQWEWDNAAPAGVVAAAGLHARRQFGHRAGGGAALGHDIGVGNAIDGDG